MGFEQIQVSHESCAVMYRNVIYLVKSVSFRSVIRCRKSNGTYYVLTFSPTTRRAVPGWAGSWSHFDMGGADEFLTPPAEAVRGCPGRPRHSESRSLRRELGFLQPSHWT